MNEKTWERFMKYVKVDEVTGCWEWQGNRDKDDYGRFMDKPKTWQAHRFSYTYVRGEIPVGAILDHKCRNHRCVNPEHLEAVTSLVNCLRGISFAAINAAKTHCKRNHPFDEANTYHYRGSRCCRKCSCLRSLAYQARKRAGETHA